MEPGETQIDSLMRETLEESGFVVKPETVREYGYVHRVQRGEAEDIFIQDNFYYICEVESEQQKQKLDDYEAEERFTLEYVLPQTAIATNRFHAHGPKDQTMLEREARVLECLIEEGYLR